MTLPSGLKNALLALESGGFALMSRAMTAAAVDASALMSTRRTLVLAPHPDDETLGCGAIVRRLRDGGHPVRVVILSDGRGSHKSAQITASALAALRRDEAVAACAQLAVPADDVRFWDHPDGSLSAHLSDIQAAIAREAADFQPEQILYPSGLDSHPDHRAVAGAVETLARAGALACPVYGYPVWFWKLSTWAALPRMLGGLRRIRLVRASTAGVLAHKRSALAAHRSQFENLTGEPDWTFLKQAFTRHFLGPAELFFQWVG